MTTQERLKPFLKLYDYLKTLDKDEFQSLAWRVANENPWFTEDNVRLAIQGVINLITPDSLSSWISKYPLTDSKKIVALVLAGNIPLVGFHDLLCVLAAGHTAQLKLSSKDRVLVEYVIEKLMEFDSTLSSRIQVVDKLQNFDAVVATGSDNSSRYFDYYFGKYPNIIRRNRTSVAVLSGRESTDDLRLLGKDVFTYFGLGCRSISKLFVPAGYTFDTLFESWNDFKEVINHHKYCNNYDYQKSLLLINRVAFFDNGFVMLQENDKIVSPISVIFFEYYTDQQELQTKLNVVAEKIQVIVGSEHPATVALGKSQSPGVCDYADNVDTMGFLSAL